jgi:hypothetical protein
MVFFIILFTLQENIQQLIATVPREIHPGTLSWDIIVGCHEKNIHVLYNGIY